ncbi:MAG: AAA family ATPase [Burkholderiales bacterium]|nr:AAA family ATPase [Burkholderiales bacterium]
MSEGSAPAHPSVPALPPQLLRRRIDPARIGAASTAELEPVAQLIGQERAVEAVRFGMAIRRQGFNVFVLGPPGLGKHTLVRRFLEAEAADAARPSDWCYVHNFEQPDRPRALELPPGRGSQLRDAMRKLAEEAAAAIRATFESEEYRTRLEELAEQFGERERKAFQDLGEEAQQQGIALIHTPAGFAFAPIRAGAVISPEEYEKLPEDERKRISETIEKLQERLQRVIRQVPQWGRERRNRLKDLHREFTTLAVDHLVAELEAEYQDLPEVVAHLAAVRRDLIDTAAQHRHAPEGAPEAVEAGPEQPPTWLRRYHANLLVAHDSGLGAPVVIEDNPTYQNLIGRVEYLSQFGALVTDFNLIKAGSLHQANGGYLMIDAHKLLTQPLAWDALKRALVARKIQITSIGQMLGLVSTVSLDPQSIPLEVKVVLFGERVLYYLLYEWDPEFRELFKVAADFEESVALDDASLQRYTRLIATVAKDEQMLAFDAPACARILEQIIRLAGDQEKLSTHMQSLADLMREADHVARAAGLGTVDAPAVAAAIEAQERRADRIKLRMQDSIAEGVLIIATGGGRVGQVNGLSVYQIGANAFGLPTRITATTRLGSGEVVDIQREVKLGGAIHSKGVLILASFLGARYAGRQPLSLSASLSFEQTYGTVEGDSASLAELCALLSSLADAPIRQDLAVTGSVSQHGEVQAIGGVNEKIEGFFDICRSKGLTGSQGVVIPGANVRHLMLREDVVRSAETGEFHIYAVDTVDQALALLTGLEPGALDETGVYPDGSFNRRIADRLNAMTLVRRELALAHKPGTGEQQ